MLAVIMATLNEDDILGRNLTHLRAHGVDEFFVVDGGSTDNTIDILHAHGCNVAIDTEKPFRQAAVMTDLARWAGERGGDWILPVDADEFWESQPTILDALAACPARKTYVPVMHYVDWEWRWPMAKLPKVAFRYEPGVTLKMGNHDCSVNGASGGYLVARELQYRSVEHFIQKVEERLSTLDNGLPRGEAAHYRALAGLDHDALVAHYEQMREKATVHDPIPVRC